MRIAPKVFKFGRNELDLRTYELRRAGRRIPLSRIPMDFLILLLEHRGQLVTREEIAARLWPDSQSLDIVQGINTVVARVRAVLNDDAANPRFIETVIGRGYRFIAEVDEIEMPPSVRPDLNGTGTPEEAVALLQVSIVQSLPELTASPDTPASQLHDALPEVQRKPRRRWIWWTIASAAALGVITGAFWFFKSTPGIESEAVLQPVPFTSLPGSERAPAFSPDGQRIAFVWNGERENNDDIYVQSVGSGRSFRITTDPAVDASPAWSPDGRQIAFLREVDSSHLNVIVVPAAGGPERVVAQISHHSVKQDVITWTPDGLHLATTDYGQDSSTAPLVSISVDDGRKYPLTSPPAWTADWTPCFSPDGQSLAFIRRNLDEIEKLYVKPTRGGDEREMPIKGILNSIAWTPDSHQLILSLGGPTGYDLWSVGLNNGRRKKLILDARDARDVSISAKSKRLAYVDYTSDSNIWRFSTQTREPAPRKLIASSRDDEDPQYSPDGRTIAFSSRRSGPSEIWTCSSEGANCMQLTQSGSNLSGSPSWSPDGKQIAFDTKLQDNTDIYVVPKEGGPMRRITTGQGTHAVPSWSRDGAWIYFHWNRDGIQQIWKIPAAGGKAVQVTANGGLELAESPDGQSLYYTSSSGTPGMWCLQFNSGKTTPIPELNMLAGTRYWELRGADIYFVDTSAHPSLHRYSFQTKRIIQLVSVPEKPLPDLRGLSVSPDGHSFLFVQNDASASNIMLVEHLSY